jgi:hypothetical protein
VYRDSWSIEQVGEQIDAIRNTDATFILPVVPSAHSDHIHYSFEMAAKGGGPEEKSH